MRDLIGIVKKLFKKSDSDNTESLFEMAGLRSDETGLPFYIWISPKGGAKHDVRVKVSKSFRYDPESCIVGLRPTVHIIHGNLSKSDFALLSRWIVLNFDTIMDFWNELIDTRQMEDRIQSI